MNDLKGGCRGDRKKIDLRGSVAVPNAVAREPSRATSRRAPWAAAASTGLSVAVLESHDAPGGAAHEWEVKGYHFESGPSLYAGLSPSASPNPLKHVFQIIGEEPEWLTSAAEAVA